MMSFWTAPAAGSPSALYPDSSVAPSHRNGFLEWGAPGLLLLIHALLSLSAARHQSPTWDEIVYPSDGIYQWHTGSLLLSSGHGYLSKLIISAPLLALHPEAPQAPPAGVEPDTFSAGYHFIFHNRVPALRLIFWSRVPSMVFSVLTGLLLFLWIRSLWGPEGGLITLICYLATPIFASRASLALIEMPMYFFIVLALLLHDRWMRNGRWISLTACSLAIALALMCKLQALPLVPVFFLIEAFGHPENVPLKKRIAAMAVLVLGISLTITAAYLPWKDHWAALQDIFEVARKFNQSAFFWHGQVLDHPAAGISLLAWLIKAPLLVLGMGLWGLARWKKSGKHRTTRLEFELFAVCCLSWPLFRGAVSTVQLSPFYLALAGIAGGLGAYFREHRKWEPVALMAIGALALAETWSVHPNYLAYFNELVGGSRQGYHWLADSDQDWGQALSQLADYLKQEGNPDLLLSYSGAADPRAYGLRYQDVFSPALVSSEYQGERFRPASRPVYLAVGTKVIQSEPGAFAWLREHVPLKTMVGSCFLIYDITRNAEAFRWLGYLYLATHRAFSAKWAFQEAQSLDPRNSGDAQILSVLKDVK